MLYELQQKIKVKGTSISWGIGNELINWISMAAKF